MYKYLDKQNTTDNFYTQQTCCPTKRQEKKFVIKLKYLYLSWALWVFLEYTIASWDWMNSKPYVNSREIPLRFVHTGISMASCDQMLQFHSLCLNARRKCSNLSKVPNLPVPCEPTNSVEKSWNTSITL